MALVLLALVLWLGFNFAVVFADPALGVRGRRSGRWSGAGREPAVALRARHHR